MAPRRKQKDAKTIVKTVEQMSRRMPRQRLRAVLDDNVSVITGNQYLTAPVVDTAQTLGYGKLALSPGNPGGLTVAPVENVAKRYQNGLYLPGTRLDYIPAVGLNTAGNIIIGYIDSPQVMLKWAGLAAGTQLAFIQGLGNVRTGPLWQPLTFPLPPNTRRKDYVIDATLTLNDTNELDLAAQGFFVWCAYGLTAPAAALTVGQLVLHTKMRCRELVGFDPV